MARLHPQQLLADVVAELRGVNERLDTLIGQSAPATLESSEPATAEPEPVRLQEPSPGGVVTPSVSSTLEVGEQVLSRDQVAQIDPDFPESGRAENAPAGTCQELTKRGNVCDRPLPCRYHP